jgi:hypothetical protein
METQLYSQILCGVYRNNVNCYCSISSGDGGSSSSSMVVLVAVVVVAVAIRTYEKLIFDLANEIRYG